MKKNLKKIVVFSFRLLGLNFLVDKILRKKVTCVGYHSVYDEKNKDEFSYDLYSNISVSTNDFEKQLLAMKNAGHSFITFADLKNPKLKEWNKPTIIYFDDGYKDNLVNALPILKKYGVPATVFVTVGLVEKSCFLWTLGLRYFLFKKNIPKIEVEKKIKELKKLSRNDRERILNEMFAKDNFVINPQNFDIFLNWDEVKELSQNGIEIGSHGMLHRKFSELTEIEFSDELINSKKIIEEKIGKKVDAVSYPYGDFDERVEKIARTAGYSFGMSTMLGLNSFEYIEEHPYGLKMIVPGANEALIYLKIFFKKIMNNKY